MSHLERIAALTQAVQAWKQEYEGAEREWSRTLDDLTLGWELDRIELDQRNQALERRVVELEEQLRWLEQATEPRPVVGELRGHARLNPAWLRAGLAR